jgi:hypothetical protein
MQRINSYRKRLPPVNINKGYGIHYVYEDIKIKDDFEETLKNAIEIIQSK